MKRGMEPSSSENQSDVQPEINTHKKRKLDDSVVTPEQKSIITTEQPLEAPATFVCPMSGQIFLDPVLLPCGASVEKEFIEKWIKDKGKSPFTRAPLTLANLTPNEVLKNEIEAFFEKHKDHASIQSIKDMQYVAATLVKETKEHERISRVSFENLLNPLIGNLYSPLHIPIQSGSTMVSIVDRMLENILGRHEINNIRSFHNVPFLLESRPLLFNFDFAPRNDSFSRYSARMMQETLEALRDHHVTETMIRQHWQPRELTSDWCGGHKDALIFLITGQPPRPILGLDRIEPLSAEFCLSPVDALREMNRLCDSGLKALMKLYCYGLRGDHLRNWRGAGQYNPNNDLFMLGYEQALVVLIEKKGIPVEEAVAGITGITEDAAWDIVRKDTRATCNIRL